jgi:hypothetical protein
MKIWETQRVPNNFWDDLNNHRDYMEWQAKMLLCVL